MAVSKNYKPINFFSTTLNGAINDAVTSAVVNSAPSFSGNKGYLIIDPTDTSLREIVEVTNVSGSTLTIVRASDGTTAKAHSNGATVICVPNAAYLNDLIDAFAVDHSIAGKHNQLTSSAGVLTLPAGPDTLVGRATTDTLTNKTLTSPTINTPTFSAGALTPITAFGQITKRIHIKLRANGGTTTEDLTASYADAITLAASNADYAVGAAPIPGDYVAGTALTLKWFGFAISGNETINYVVGATSLRDGQAVTGGDIRTFGNTTSSFAMSTITGTICSQNLGSTNVSSGMSVGVGIRAASNGQSHKLVDCWIEYTAYI